ncbi:hypothetical protein BKA69DRAFT_1049495 [Paraphysoderma sedebokerense]|nr:hypothetical protein BKA69DRAFT_1049495 [Paraphysoderma sedebokerense]
MLRLLLNHLTLIVHQMDACPGYANNSCGGGYTGTRCALCEKFHYKLNNRCVSCAENSLVPLLTVMALLVVFAIGIALLAALEKKGPGYVSIIYGGPTGLDQEKRLISAT